MSSKRRLTPAACAVAETVLVSDGYDVDKLISDELKPIHKNIIITSP